MTPSDHRAAISINGGPPEAGHHREDPDCDACGSQMEIRWVLAHGATEAGLHSMPVGSVRAIFESASAMQRECGPDARSGHGPSGGGVRSASSAIDGPGGLVFAVLVVARVLGALVPMLVTSGNAAGQAFPTRPVRIVTTQPGSGFDLASRVIAEGLSARLGQQAIVDNRGGAGGVIAGEIVARAAPDGHTLLSYGPAIWLIQFIRKGVPFDPMKDFAPITWAVSSPNVLVVHPAVQASSVRELIALAKARPSTLNFGGGNTGSSAHLAGELFKSRAGIDIVHVPYKSTGQSVAALAAGEVQLMFPNATTASAYIREGRLRALAVTTAEPTDLVPGVPTLAASGLPGYVSAANLGVFAPAKTPAALVQRLHADVVGVLTQPAVKSRFFNTGTLVIASSPQELRALMASEMATLGKLIQRLGIGAL